MWIVQHRRDDMTPDPRQRLWARLALAAGVVLFLIALRLTDWSLIRANGSRFLSAALAAILVSGSWHTLRTIAWARCFPPPARLPFARLLRVRLAAEAVSYVTVRGVAGEPLKVILLGGAVDSTTATAAVALERLAYIIFTALIVGIGGVVAVLTLPLAAAWSRTFLSFAGASALFAVGAGTLLFGPGSSSGPAPGASRSDRPTASPAAGFVRSAARQLRALARGDRRRLIVLAAAMAASYSLMALEAWLVFRIAGAPISVGQAFAIETFTRVASFASAVIPGNLGALEVASLAAAAAVGSPSGAFLALARRVRGLFWAGIGFLVYPRTIGPSPSASINGSAPREMFVGPLLLYIAEDPRVDVSPVTRIAGLPVAERVVRAALRAGYSKIVVLAPDSPLSYLCALDTRVSLVSDRSQWGLELASLPGALHVTAIGPGTVVSTELLVRAREVTGASRSVVDVAAGPSFPNSGVIRTSLDLARDPGPVADALVERVTRNDPSPSGDDVSRARAQLAIRIASRPGIDGADCTLKQATYKQTDAKVARFNRRISLPISIALLRTPVTANAMSLFVCVLGLLSGWLFARGEYLTGVAAAALSLAASILDGCDGEIARLKYQESALGCWLETIGDYSYYLAIFAGLTAGAVQQTGRPVYFVIGVVALTGTVLSFLLLIFLRQRITRGRPETLHAVARSRFQADRTWWSVVIWRVSFVATRAAMPYGILALALVNLLPLVVILSAVGANVYWISLVLKLRYLLGEPDTADARRTCSALPPAAA
jgi:phosphatidylglycerophosphate synthase